MTLAKNDRTLLIYLVLFEVYIFGLYIIFGLFKVLLTVIGFLSSLLERAKFAALEKKKLVIVGGGYAGTYAAVKLQNHFDTTLIDTKSYFEFTPSKLRTLVQPSHSKVVQIRHDKILNKTNLISDYVQEVTTDTVQTSRTQLPYDYLIICSGSRYAEPRFAPIMFDPQNTPFHNIQPATIVSVRSKDFEDYHQTLLHCDRILIIGGGTVGVELAAEIVENFPHKHVTLVHSQTRLMNRSPQKAIDYSENYFINNGVRLILGERVVANTGNLFQTSSGTIMQADLAFVCTGNVPNSDFLKNSFPDKLNPFGYIQVNEHLQMAGYRNIFVAGDITDVPQEEEKLCQTAGAETSVVIKNLINIEKRQPLHVYDADKFPMVVSLGKYDGIFFWYGWTLTGFIPAVMKEFVEWKELIWYWDWSRFKGESHYMDFAHHSSGALDV